MWTLKEQSDLGPHVLLQRHFKNQQMTESRRLLVAISSRRVNVHQGSHRLEKYLNIQDCLEKSLKIKIALKST